MSNDLIGRSLKDQSRNATSIWSFREDETFFVSSRKTVTIYELQEEQIYQLDVKQSGS